MDWSDLFNRTNGKTPSEMKEIAMLFFSAMPPERFFDHLTNLRVMGQQDGQAKEREEIVCRLLASGMPVEGIAMVLCIRTDVVRTIEQNNAAITIPKYAKKLKESRRRREKQAGKNVSN